ncbi:MAG: hypothetical protein LIO58_09005 [Oscillospiraceae bacterium]|nr:hypothetical protein [Oscillospiraceae bacterium]
MLCIGIWEETPLIGRFITPYAAKIGAAALQVSTRAQCSGQTFDLLVVAPAVKWQRGTAEIRCKGLLLSGTSAALARRIHADYVVSYGTSAKDSITFSSLERGELLFTLQRELVTLSGTVVERQELCLPFSGVLAPLPFLSVAGALLLMGLPPDELPAFFI